MIRILAIHGFSFRSEFLMRMALVLFTASGCNHLFYQPDYDLHASPSVFQIPYRQAWIQVDEESKIQLWHLDAGPESLGTVIHFHGNAENMSSHFLFAAWLVKYGYDVVTFDYRGYGQSSGTPSREGVVQDGKAVIEWVRKHKKLGSGDVFVFGQSLGGAVAIPSVVASGQKGINAVIVDSTFASYREIARDRLGNVWLTWPLQYPLSWLITDELSPIDDVGNLTMPLLVVHGVRDPVVPIALGKKLFQAANPKRREFWEVELAGHTSGFFGESTPYKPRLVDYLCKKSSEPESCQAP